MPLISCLLGHIGAWARPICEAGGYGVRRLVRGAVRKSPRGATAFPHRDALFYSELGVGWGKRSDQPGICDPLTPQAQAWIAEFSQALRPYVDGAYVNVPNIGMQDWETAYWGSNFSRLRRIKADYCTDGGLPWVTTTRRSSTRTRRPRRPKRSQNASWRSDRVGTGGQLLRLRAPRIRVLERAAAPLGVRRGGESGAGAPDTCGRRENLDSAARASDRPPWFDETDDRERHAAECGIDHLRPS
ncbi:BBE domain-containing protein [Streptomyces olivochromogenes]|uniref:BBE domain-containing protein n=1 Tax=Streptomyces olivochromogenes TaxID=1963 RepID=UPI003678F2C1